MASSATPTNLEIGNIKNTVNHLIFSVFCFYGYSLISNDINCVHLIRCATVKVEGDNFLVNELINGNEKAFRKLFDSYRNHLYKFSLSMVCSENRAEEIVQDVFMKIWIKRGSLNPEMSFKSYLFTITRNKTIKFLKKASNYRKLREAVFLWGAKICQPYRSLCSGIGIPKAKSVGQIIAKKQENF